MDGAGYFCISGEGAAINKTAEMIWEVVQVLGGGYRNEGVVMQEPPVSGLQLLQDGASCSEIWNWARARVGLPAIGGTVAYANGENWNTGEKMPGFSWSVYDPSGETYYWEGTYLINPDVIENPNYVDESHMMMVSDYGSQYTLQSDDLDGIHNLRTHWEEHNLMCEYGHGIKWAVWYQDQYS